MATTKQQLKQLIREELRAIHEDGDPTLPPAPPRDQLSQRIAARGTPQLTGDEQPKVIRVSDGSTTPDEVRQAGGGGGDDFWGPQMPPGGPAILRNLINKVNSTPDTNVGARAVKNLLLTFIKEFPIQAIQMELSQGRQP